MIQVITFGAVTAAFITDLHRPELDFDSLYAFHSCVCFRIAKGET